MIGLTFALLSEVLRNMRISLNNARRRQIQRRLIRQERCDYTEGFREEEIVCTCYASKQDVGETLADLHQRLAMQFEQDQEEPPRLTPVTLLDELDHLGNQARDMGLPFIIGVQVPGYTRIYMSSNITPAHTDTQIMCAYHDLSR